MVINQTLQGRLLVTWSDAEDFINELAAALDDANRRAAEAEAKLAPSPCGHGHRMADWVSTEPIGSETYRGDGVREYMGHCLACREREAILAKARLEEAEWWAEFGCIKEFHEQVTNAKDYLGDRLSRCEHCDRLAQLRKEASHE